MVRSRPAWPALVAVLLLATLVPPLGVDAQSTESLCDAPGGQDVPDATERSYNDYALVLQNVRYAIGDDDPAAPDKQGAYHLTTGPGELSLDLRVTNDGTGTGGGGGTIPVRITIGQPNGQATVETVQVPAPNRGAGQTQSYSVNLTQTGRYTVTALVNPGGATNDVEVCEDPAGTPNPDCGNAPCRVNHFGPENGASTGLLVGKRPDLVVSAITATGPVRAVDVESNDARATVRATVQNVGDLTAFNLDDLQIGAQPITVRFAIEGGASGTATFNQLAPGAATTVELSLRTHGLADSFNVTATADSTGKVNESDEADNSHTVTLPIPTADLAVSVLSDLPTVDGRRIIPKGQDLSFSVLLQNLGDAAAASNDGSTFSVRILRDTANTVSTHSFTLGAHSSRTITVTDSAENLDADHEYTIQADNGNRVLESSETNNEIRFPVTVADYSFDLNIKEVDAKPTVPPGVEGRVPFEVVNTGTVADTFTLSLPPEDREVGRFVDANGFTISQFELKKGGSLKGELVFMIPSTASEGDPVETEIRVHSQGDGDITTRGIAFTVGPDDVPPTVALHEPASGYLAKDTLVLRIVDNVNVTHVEVDVGTGAVEVSPDQPHGTLYTVDVTGRPTRFAVNVRATDSAGNSANQTLNLVRDRTDPRIAQFLFVPDRPARPGDKVTVVIEARDDSGIDRVDLRIFQPRPNGDHYDERHNLTRSGANHQLRDWVVPERPGHYIFNATVYDQAGNSVSQRKTLIVNGLDLRAPPGRERATVNVPRPAEGDRVVFTWLVQNTNPTFASGDFAVGFILDDDREIGRQTLNLGPGETRAVSFVWFATPGPHTWNIVIDRTLLVAEDDETNNVLGETHETLFGNHALFRTGGGSSDTSTASLVVDSVVEHWYMPVLFVAAAVLFAIAVVLGRRPGA